MQFPTHLQYVALKTLTNDDCRSRSHKGALHRFYEGTLCAFAQKGQGACYADSGGPLTTNGQLIGLTSWGDPCALGVPDAYTRVSVFLNWIRDVSGVKAV